MAELSNIGVASNCVSFDYWRHCWSGTALAVDNEGFIGRVMHDSKDMLYMARQIIIKKENIDVHKISLNEFPRNFGKSDAVPSMRYMRTLVDAGFLFGRKLGLDEYDELSNNLSTVLPVLWSTWDNKFGTPTQQKLMYESTLWPSLDIQDKPVQQSAALRLLSKPQK